MIIIIIIIIIISPNLNVLRLQSQKYIYGIITTPQFPIPGLQFPLFRFQLQLYFWSSDRP